MNNPYFEDFKRSALHQKRPGRFNMREDIEFILKNQTIDEPQYRKRLLDEIDMLYAINTLCRTDIIEILRSQVERFHSGGYPTALTDAQIDRNIKICTTLAMIGDDDDKTLAEAAVGQYTDEKYKRGGQ